MNEHILQGFTEEIDKLATAGEWLASGSDMVAAHHNKISRRARKGGISAAIGGELRDIPAVVRDVFNGKAPLITLTIKQRKKYKRYLDNRK